MSVLRLTRVGLRRPDEGRVAAQDVTVPGPGAPARLRLHAGQSRR